MAIRAASHHICGSLLEKLLNADGGGYLGVRVECGRGYWARLIEYRGKASITALSAAVSDEHRELLFWEIRKSGYGELPTNTSLEPYRLWISTMHYAREHLAKVARLLYGSTSQKSQQWLSARRNELDNGDVENITGALNRLRPKDKPVRKEVKTELEYFQRNTKRMRSAEFRNQGLFV